MISGSVNAIYPMAASYAAVSASLGHPPTKCRPIAMEIFCPGAGEFYPMPVLAPDGINVIPDPPERPDSVSFTIGPLSFSSGVTWTSPMYNFYNSAVWSVPGELEFGTGAYMTFPDLYTSDITTTLDSGGAPSGGWGWGVNWPDNIVWFSESI